MAVMSTGMIDGVSPPGATDSGAATDPPPRLRWRWLVMAVVTLGLVLVAAFITGLALGAAYQPVGLGLSPGNLAGHMITRQVDNFSPMTGQTYLPPQRPASAAGRPGAAAGPIHSGAPARYHRGLLDAGEGLCGALHLLGQGQVPVLDPPGPDLVDQPLRSV